MNSLPTVTFRRATVDDLALMRRLWPHCPPEEACARLCQRTRWVALGHCEGALVASGELIRCGRTVEIANVLVLPQWRRRGIGRALVTHLCDLARRQRVKRVQLTVDPANTAALALYAQAGFVAVGSLELPSAHPLILMERCL